MILKHFLLDAHLVSEQTQHSANEWPFHIPFSLLQGWPQALLDAHSAKALLCSWAFLFSSWAFLRCLTKFSTRIKKKQILWFGLKRFCACPAKCWAGCLGPLNNMWQEVSMAKSNVRGRIQKDAASSPWKRRHLSLNNEEKRKSCFSMGLVMPWSI